MSKRTKRSSASGPRVRRTAQDMAQQYKEISFSQFVTKNRHLLGFDNPTRATLMVVKEAVDNSLDACEEAGILPTVLVEVTKKGAEDRLEISITDNGPGIVKDHIPNIFGKLLFGSKFHRLKQARGQQGIGISAAGLYSLITTGQSMKIWSRTSPRKPAHHFEIQIDMNANKPNTLRDEEIPEETWRKECNGNDQGTKVQVVIVGSYIKGRRGVEDYLRQTAIANPHAELILIDPDRKIVSFPRAVTELPADPKEIKPHPYGVELGILMQMLASTRARSLQQFLTSEFSRVSSRVARQICETAKLEGRARPSRIAKQEADNLLRAINATRIMNPATDCIVPISEPQIEAGLRKEVQADFYCTCTRPPAVYRGNPFQIEVGLAYGGQAPPDEPATVLRYANRVPLLYQPGACVITKAIQEVDWRAYHLPTAKPRDAQNGRNGKKKDKRRTQLPYAPLTMLVHLASVWVPFTSEAKDAIAGYDVILKELKLALQECGRKLARYLSHARALRREADRRRVFFKYIADVVESCHALLPARVKKQQLQEKLEVVAKSKTGGFEELPPDPDAPRGMEASEESDEEEEIEEAELVAPARKNGRKNPLGQEKLQFKAS